MDIEKLTPEQIAHLQVGCYTLAKSDLGNIINGLIDDITDETHTTTISTDVINGLNNMCVFNGCYLGDVLNLIVEALAAESPEEIPMLNNQQVKALNNTCGTLHGVALGDKLNEMIEAINSREEVE